MAQRTVPSLGAGEWGTILSLTTSRLETKRLADMGFVRGSRVEMVRPGEPCIVRLRDRCVGLGVAHQQSILLAQP